AMLNGTSTDISIANGRIQSVRPHAPETQPENNSRFIDAKGLHVFPSFRNAHTHVAMVLFRGYGDDMPLMEWLRTKIWPAEAKLDPEDVYWGVRLACIEMVRSGTTRFFDMYWFGPDVARAVTDSGLRAGVSSVMIDEGDPAKGEAMRPQVLDWLARIGEAGERIVPCLGPHAIYTVSRE